MKHVILTGSAGLIGSHLTEELLKRGYAVTGVDNFLTGQRANLKHVQGNPGFDFLEWDVCKPIPEAQLSLVKKYGVFAVLHFACPASPVDFERIPFEILDVDSLGTKFTVELALKHRARYVLASTSEIYGDPLEHPQKETYWGNANTIGPRACYDETKRFAEAFVSSAARWKDLNGGMVRIFNTYGPRMRPDDGRVVSEFCIQALKGKDLTVHGEGLQTRSYCFVTDLVDGVIRYMESSLKDPVNLGNPIERTVREFAEIVIQTAGSKSKLTHLPAREDDPKKRCPDITRAKEKLGWQPKVDLKEGLVKTLEYFKQCV